MKSVYLGLKVFGAIFLVALSFNVLAEVSSSSNFEIERDSINSGGDLSTSVNYILEDTIGENPGGMTGSSYIITGGYQQNDEDYCNENGLCEANLGETVDGCPADCHLGGIIMDDLRLINAGDPIIVSNVIFNVILEDQIEISWNTNKPTSDNLVFVDGMGGTEGGYLDSFYTMEHSVILEDFDINKEYYFKIFSQGTHGDDNFDTAKIFALKVANIEDFEEAVKKAEKNEFFIDYDVFIDERMQYLCDSGIDIEKSLKNICEIKAPEKETFQDPNRPIYYDEHFLYDWGYRFKQILYKIRILKRGISIRNYISIFN